MGFDWTPGGRLSWFTGNGDPSAERQAQRKQAQQEANDPNYNPQGEDPTKPGYRPPNLGPSGQYTDATGDPGYRAGIDDTAWGHVVQPSAYETEQHIGAAKEEEDRYKALAAAADNRQSAQMNLDMYNSDRGLDLQSRGNQDTALGKYLDLANGKGPSLAQAQANLGMAQSNAQQASIAAGARGGGANLVAAQQAGANAAGAASANVIGQATMAREKEQMDALAGYGQMATQMRANDLQRSGLSEQQAYQQATIEQNQHQLNDARNLNYEQLRQSMIYHQDANRQAGEAANAGAYFQNQQNATQNRAIDQSQTNAVIGGVSSSAAAAIPMIAMAAADEKGTPSGSGSMGWVPQGWNSTTNGSAAANTPYRQTSGASTTPTAPAQMTNASMPGAFPQQQQQPQMSPYLRQPRTTTAPQPQQPALSPYVRPSGTAAPSAAMRPISSDVRGKKDIGDGAPAVRAQMGAMAPADYQYKDPSAPGAGPGPRVGVMAQDMERGPYGHQLVKNTPHGKQIDGPGALSLALASGADHEQRLRQLEAAANSAVGKQAREQAYDAWYAERQKSPGFRAAQAYEERQQNAPPFRSFVPEGAIQTKPAPYYPTAPATLDTNPQQPQPLAMYLRPQNGGQ